MFELKPHISEKNLKSRALKAIDVKKRKVENKKVKETRKLKPI